MYHLLHVIVVLYKGVKGQELSKRLAAKFKSSVYVPRLRLLEQFQLFIRSKHQVTAPSYLKHTIKHSVINRLENAQCS